MNVIYTLKKPKNLHLKQRRFFQREDRGEPEWLLFVLQHRPSLKVKRKKIIFCIIIRIVQFIWSFFQTVLIIFQKTLNMQRDLIRGNCVKTVFILTVYIRWFAESKKIKSLKIKIINTNFLFLVEGTQEKSISLALYFGILFELDSITKKRKESFFVNVSQLIDLMS